MHRQFSRSASISLFVLVTATSVFAADQTWKAAPSGTAWNTAGNWVGNAVPGGTGSSSADTATFSAAVTNGNGTINPVTIDAGRNIRSIVFDSAAASAYVIGSTGGNSLKLSNGGSIQVAAGVLNSQTVNAPLLLGGTTGAYSIANNAASSAATLSLGGGITPLATSGTTTLTLGGSNTGNNTVGGVLGNGAGSTLAVAKSGSGTWILAANNTYTGATSVTAGSLVVTGSLAGGTVTVGTSGTLAGTGALGGAVTINGIIAPGAGGVGDLSTGNLSITATGTLDIELGRDGISPSSDRVHANGSVTLGSGANLALTLASGYNNPAANDLFWLIANDGADAVGGAFAKLNGIAADLSEGSTFLWNSQTWQITYSADFANSSFFGGNDIALQMVAVPEPNAIALLMLAAAGIVLRRRSRRVYTCAHAAA